MNDNSAWEIAIVYIWLAGAILLLPAAYVDTTTDLLKHYTREWLPLVYNDVFKGPCFCLNKYARSRFKRVIFLYIDYGFRDLRSAQQQQRTKL